jgi:hypothetical protein
MNEKLKLYPQTSPHYLTFFQTKFNLKTEIVTFKLILNNLMMIINKLINDCPYSF